MLIIASIFIKNSNYFKFGYNETTYIFFYKVNTLEKYILTLIITGIFTILTTFRNECTDSFFTNDILQEENKIRRINISKFELYVTYCFHKVKKI